MQLLINGKITHPLLMAYKIENKVTIFIKSQIKVMGLIPTTLQPIIVTLCAFQPREGRA